LLKYKKKIIVEHFCKKICFIPYQLGHGQEDAGGGKGGIAFDFVELFSFCGYFLHFHYCSYSCFSLINELIIYS